MIDVATGKITTVQSQCSTCYDPTWLETEFVFYGEAYEGEQIKRFDWKRDKTRTIGPVKHYAGEISSVFTANAAYLYWSRLPSATGNRHIYAVQHHTQGTPDTAGG